ncbi:CPBP family intramembrane glutamic endopeptidase [Agromyces atrinae]|uniref:Membrane protease YdiL (CAAX protease family) n=1 Tax=Agromyces atrinae TaxID=592376 RepID=A0A852SJH8_9MICO|nr:CPBP family intramembrane glutamic endopeptidase [Agromyces atrinae]NYD66307.1 membrane protease YdiL (CAAX protease family) [Agromyces atrinae]
MVEVITQTKQSGWARFWNHGGWWRALLLVVGYLVIYEGIGLLIGTAFHDQIDTKNLFATPESIVFGIALAILIAGLLALTFTWSVGWLREVFGRQPVAGRGWMWIAVPLLVIPIILRAAGTDWSKYTVAVILTTLAFGLCVGFAEELVTRGLAVNILRRGGYSERVVMVISSLLFALMHSINALNGQAPLTVVITVLYTFGFGTMMYLVMRVTGSIIWPMLLHAATDPTTFLATGGIDTTTASAGSAELLSLAGIFNWIYIVFAIVAIFLVKGTVFPERKRLR